MRSSAREVTQLTPPLQQMPPLPSPVRTSAALAETCSLSFTMDIRCMHSTAVAERVRGRMQINFVPRASQHCHFDMTFEWSPCPDVSMAGSHSMSDSDRCRWPRSFNPQSISPNTDSLQARCSLERSANSIAEVPRHCTNCRRRRRVSVQLCAAQVSPEHSEQWHREGVMVSISENLGRA